MGEHRGFPDRELRTGHSECVDQCRRPRSGRCAHHVDGGRRRRSGRAAIPVLALQRRARLVDDGQRLFHQQSFTWTPGPGDDGTYQLQVAVRQSGSTTPADASAATAPFDVVDDTMPTIVAVTRDTGTTLRPGMPIVWTAYLAGGRAPLEYAFARWNSATRAVDPGPELQLGQQLWLDADAGRGRLRMSCRCGFAGRAAPHLKIRIRRRRPSSSTDGIRRLPWHSSAASSN